MKPKEIQESEETYKKETGFVYIPGNISSLGREPSPEEIREDIADRLAEGRCPRCDGSDFGPNDRGDVFCKSCGQRQNLK